MCAYSCAIITDNNFPAIAIHSRWSQIQLLDTNLQIYLLADKPEVNTPAFDSQREICKMWFDWSDLNFEPIKNLVSNISVTTTMVDNGTILTVLLLFFFAIGEGKYKQVDIDIAGKNENEHAKIFSELELKEFDGSNVRFSF